MRFECHINMDGAAFHDDNPVDQLRYILTKALLDMGEGGLDSNSVRDSNGNRVGAWSIVDEQRIPPFPNKH